MPALALPAGAQSALDKLQAAWNKAAPHLKASSRPLPAAVQLHPSPWSPGKDVPLQLVALRNRLRLSAPLLSAAAAAAAAARRCWCPPGVDCCTPLTRARKLHSPMPQTALHVGYIPAIILLGMTQTEPRPSWGQLLGPM